MGHGVGNGGTEEQLHLGRGEEGGVGGRKTHMMQECRERMNLPRPQIGVKGLDLFLWSLGINH